MVNLVLTRDELIELTGYKQPKRQVAWLRQQAIPLYVAANGRPKVLRSTLESTTVNRRTEPNFAALRRVG
ncbi:DUF4224 domain-containing protein [Streptococcus pseudopneumoniae]|uniref:DUF4224 domain-containing protein n=1 Tax=Streptococcus pseudopneumoniae TaxID=257758 RepID=UPI00110C2D7A|nr:DUF4224 domain-containing protein [Streptococcus pseudopneumoniae]